MSSLFTPTQLTSYDAALDNVFDTFKRPIMAYVEAQAITLSSSMTYSRFGQHDQNVLNPPVTPQGTQIYACIRYGNGQAYDFMAPGSDVQLKLRESEGLVRIKVDATGYEIMKNAKTVVLDGFTFTIDSTPRPHGLVTPHRWTFMMRKTD